MKSDTERKRYFTEGLHKRKNRLHVHLSKDLRGKLKAKKRAVLVREGDVVRVMRGPHKGKEKKVSRVSTVERKVFLEDITIKNKRGREKAVPLEPSNLLLISLESTPERKEIFSDEAFKKKAEKKAEAEKKESAPAAEKDAAEPKHEHASDKSQHERKGEAHSHEHKHDAAKPPEQKPANIR